MTEKPYKVAALEKIRRKAHLAGFACSNERWSREFWDIYWLAQAGLEDQSKAAGLDTFTALSGQPTDDPERTLERSKT